MDWNKKFWFSGNCWADFIRIGTGITELSGTVVSLLASTICPVVRVAFGVTVSLASRFLHLDHISTCRSILKIACSGPKISSPISTFACSWSTMCSWCVILANAGFWSTIPSIRIVMIVYLLQSWVCAPMPRTVILILLCLILMCGALCCKNAQSMRDIVQPVLPHMSWAGPSNCNCALKVAKCHDRNTSPCDASVFASDTMTGRFNMLFTIVSASCLRNVGRFFCWHFQIWAWSLLFKRKLAAQFRQRMCVAIPTWYPCSLW